MGTDLGLAQVYGIVKQHQGTIDVDSEEGLGTTFVIYLPLASEVGTTLETIDGGAVDRGRDETILIVEDDMALRHALVGTLALLGYPTLEAANGREALAVLRGSQAEAEVDLVLSDLVHTLAYGGMGVFPGRTTDLPAELWLGARALQAVSLLVAALLPNVSREDRLPTAYVEGVGLTPFKRISKYVISAVFLASGFLFRRVRRRYDPAIGYLILIPIAGTVAAELAFTFYIDIYDFSTVAGHLFKIVSFCLASPTSPS